MNGSGKNVFIYHIRVDSSTYDSDLRTYVLGEGRQLFWLEVCGGPDFEHYFCFLPFLGHMLLCLQTDLETFLKPTLLKCWFLAISLLFTSLCSCVYVTSSVFVIQSSNQSRGDQKKVPFQPISFWGVHCLAQLSIKVFFNHPPQTPPLFTSN